MLSKTWCRKSNNHCYIAMINGKRDWLICSHVTLDKCNVSHRTSKKLLPALRLWLFRIPKRSKCRDKVWDYQITYIEYRGVTRALIGGGGGEGGGSEYSYIRVLPDEFL